MYRSVEMDGQCRFGKENRAVQVQYPRRGTASAVMPLDLAWQMLRNATSHFFFGSITTKIANIIIWSYVDLGEDVLISIKTLKPHRGELFIS